MSLCTSSLQQITKSEVHPPWALEHGSKVTPTYPSRRTLTIKPLGSHQASPPKQDLEVHLTLNGVETCDNPREFILKSPSVKSHSMTASHRMVESPLKSQHQGNKHFNCSHSQCSVYSIAIWPVYNPADSTWA